jgi:hypothetical protein
MAKRNAALAALDAERSGLLSERQRIDNQLALLADLRKRIEADVAKRSRAQKKSRGGDGTPAMAAEPQHARHD